MQTNEHELIKLAAEGDKKAWETLLNSVQDMVYNLSLRMLGSISDAEDATQEIIIRIITHLSGFRKDRTFSTLKTIKVHYIILMKIF